MLSNWIKLTCCNFYDESGNLGMFCTFSSDITYGFIQCPTSLAQSRAERIQSVSLYCGTLFFKGCKFHWFA